MTIDNNRARIERQAVRLAALLQPATGDRPRLQSMVRRVAAAWRTEPAYAEALRIGGAEAVAALLRMREAARDPAIQAMLRGAK